MEFENIVELINNNTIILWALGIIIPLSIPVIIPKIRRKIKKIIYHILLKIQGDNVGINAVYLKNYYGKPNGKFTDIIFEKIKDEISYDKIEKVSIHPFFLKIKSQKLGMKLDISIQAEQTEVLDEEYQKIPYNVTVEMDADIKGTTNIHNLDNFITIAEKIHEIIRTELFPSIELEQSYTICVVNNINNEIAKFAKKSFEIAGDKITIDKDSTTILSHNPHNLTKVLKKYVYV